MNNKQDFSVTTDSQPATDDRYLSVRSISRMFDIKEDTIRKWIAKRYIPKHSFRGLVRVKLSDIESLRIRKPSKEEIAKKMLRVV